MTFIRNLFKDCYSFVDMILFGIVWAIWYRVTDLLSYQTLEGFIVLIIGTTLIALIEEAIKAP
jgi:hypothetical protein